MLFAFTWSKPRIRFGKAMAADFIGQGGAVQYTTFPGAVQPPSLEERIAAWGGGPEARRASIDRRPMGRLGTPEPPGQMPRGKGGAIRSRPIRYHRVVCRLAERRMRTACSDAELQAMTTDVESDLIERKETFDGDAPRTVREAICAFTNDLPGRRRPGVVFVGARDNGTPTGLEINDVVPGSAVRIDPAGTNDPGCAEVEITPRDMLAGAISTEGSTS